MKNITFILHTFLALIISAILIQKTSGSHILVFNALGTHSTRISMTPYMEALADNGHNVTYLSAFENNDPNEHPKIIDYVPKKLKEAMGPWEAHIKFYDVRKNKRMVKMWYDLLDHGVAVCELLYSEPEFVDWVKSSKFDLIVVESVVNECAYGLVHFFKSRSIAYSTTTVLPSFLDANGLPDESSSVTDLTFNFPAGNQMSFWERFVNTINPIVSTLIRQYSYFPKLEEITRKGLDLDEVPRFSDLEKQLSLTLLTSHYSMDYARSFPPNVIPIGGTVVSKRKKPLPKDMEKFINEGKEGFIFISFGSVTEFVNFDEEVQQEFIAALYNFPDLKFVWKSSYQINATLPSNVFVTTWAPQQTLLAHPKIKGFVTHAGMGSTTEAIHFSVPVVCSPVMAEQDLNCEALASREAGIKIEIVGLKRQEFEHALSEILYNKKYRIGMTKLTEIFKDRQTPPIETAVWWTEYILRHENTNSFLRSPSVGLSWWIKRNVDLWFVVFLCAQFLCIISLYTMYVTCRKIQRLSSNSERKTVEKKKQ